MTDEQIADFVFQLKYVVETYKLDGVNYFDIEASYGKDGYARCKLPHPTPN